jgi:hypothetical protein
MNATLTGGVLAPALSAFGGYAQPAKPKGKRFVWDRPEALAFKILPNGFTIHPATTSVILLRVTGAATSLTSVDALPMDRWTRTACAPQSGRTLLLEAEHNRVSVTSASRNVRPDWR